MVFYKWTSADLQIYIFAIYYLFIVNETIETIEKELIYNKLVCVLIHAHQVHNPYDVVNITNITMNSQLILGFYDENEVHAVSIQTNSQCLLGFYEQIVMNGGVTRNMVLQWCRLVGEVGVKLQKEGTAGAT